MCLLIAEKSLYADVIFTIQPSSLLVYISVFICLNIEAAAGVNHKDLRNEATGFYCRS